MIQIFECGYCGLLMKSQDDLIEHEEGCPEVLEEGSGGGENDESGMVLSRL